MKTIKRPLILVCTALAMLAWNSLALCDQGTRNTPAATAATTTIFEAAKSGDLARIQALLKNNPDLVSSKDDNDETALHWAAMNGHDRVAELLLAKGAEVDATDNEGMTPLHWAAFYGRLDVVKLLLANKAAVNVRSGDMSPSGLETKTPLLLAAESGHNDIMELLLSHGADINAKDNFGETPLQLAVEHGYRNEVELLLARNADVNAKDLHGRTALHAAAKEGSKDIVELLVGKGAEVNAKDYRDWTPLHEAARTGHLDVAEVLLANGADLEAISKDGGPLAKDVDAGTPLHVAARNDHQDVAELLLAKGANVNAKDYRGWTPLHDAINNGHKNKRTQLYSYYSGVYTSGGAIYGDVAVPSRDKRPEPRYVADPAMVELLLAKGANVNAQDNNGATPLYLAASNGDTNMVALLLNNHAVAGLKGDLLPSPLSAAAEGGFADVVNLFDENGRDLTVIAKDYQAFILAGYPQFERLLIRAMDQYGDKEMATVYLNCGNPTLEAAAKAWASARGYSILPSPEGARTDRWGGN